MKLSEATSRIFSSLFDEGVVEEVKRDVEALLGERYPEVLKTTEEMVFGKREAGRGNPFNKAAACEKGPTA